MSHPRILNVHSQQKSDTEKMQEPLIIPKKDIGTKFQENQSDCEIIMIDSENDENQAEETSKTAKLPEMEVRRETSMELVDPVKLTEKMPPETKQAVAALCRNTSLSLQLLPNNTPRRVSQSSSKSAAKVAQLSPQLSRKVAHLVPTVARKVAQLEQNLTINTAQSESEAPIEVVQFVPVVSSTKTAQLVPTTLTTSVSQSVSNVPATNTKQLVPTVPATVAQLVTTVSSTLSQSVTAAPQQIAQFLLHTPGQMAQTGSTVSPAIAQFVLSAPVNVSPPSLNAPVTIAQFVLAPPVTKVSQSPRDSTTRNVTQFVLTPPVTKVAQSLPNSSTMHIGQLSPNGSSSPIASETITNAAAATIAQFMPMASSTSMTEYLPIVPTVKIPPMVPSNSLKVEQMITNAAAKLAQMGTNPTPANLPQTITNSYSKVAQTMANMTTRGNNHTTIMHKKPNVVMVLPVNNTSGGPFKSPTICTLERIQNPNEISMIKQAAAAQRQKQTGTQNNATTVSSFVVGNVVNNGGSNSMNNNSSNVVSTVARVPKNVVNVENNEERSLNITCNVPRTLNVVGNEERSSITTCNVARPSNIVSNVVRTTTTVVNDVSRGSNVTNNVLRTSTAVSDVVRASNVVRNVVWTSTVVNEVERPSTIITDVARPLNVMTNVPRSSNIERNIKRTSNDEKHASEIRKKLLHNLFMKSTAQRRRMMTEIHHVPWSDEKSREEEFFAESQKALVPLTREAATDPFGIAKRALSLAKRAAAKGPQARVSLVDVRKLLAKGLRQVRNSALSKERNNDDGDSSIKMTNHTRPKNTSIVSGLRNSRLTTVRRNTKKPKLLALARIQARLTKAITSLDQTRRSWKAQCIVCNDKFNDKYEFHRHATLAHPDVQIVFCELCNDTFLTDAELKDHRLSYHKITVMKDNQGNIKKIEENESETFEPLETIKSENEILRPTVRKKKIDGRRKASRLNRAVFETIPGHSQDSYRGRMMKKRAAVAAAKAAASRKKLSQYSTRRRKPMTKNKTRKTGYDYVDEDVAIHGSVINKNKFKSAEIKKLIVPLTRLQSPVLDKYLAKLATRPITCFSLETSENPDNFKKSHSDEENLELEHLRGSSMNLSSEISIKHEKLDAENLNVEPETLETRENLEKNHTRKKPGPKRMSTVGHSRGRGRNIHALQLAREAKAKKKNEQLKNNGENENTEIANEPTSTDLNLPNLDENQADEKSAEFSEKVQKSIHIESDESADDDNWTISYIPEVTSDGNDEESGTIETSVTIEVSGDNEKSEIDVASGTKEISGEKTAEWKKSEMTETTAMVEESEIKEASRKEKSEMGAICCKEKSEMSATSEKDNFEFEETSGMNEKLGTIEESSKSKISKNIEKAESDTAPIEISLSQNVTLVEIKDDKKIAGIVKERPVIRKLVSKSSATSCVILENKRERNLQTEKRTIDDPDTKSISVMKKSVNYFSSDENPQNERIEAKKAREISSMWSKSSSDDERETSNECIEIEESPKLRTKISKLPNDDGKTLVERLRSRRSQTWRSTLSSSDEKVRKGCPKLNNSPTSRPTSSKSLESSEKRQRGRPRVNKSPVSPANSAKLFSSPENRPKGRPRSQKSPSSQPKSSRPPSDDETSFKELAKFDKSLHLKSSETLNNNEDSLSEDGEFLKSLSSERNKFSTRKPLLNSTKNHKHYEEILGQMAKENDCIDYKEKQLEEKTDDEHKQLMNQNYDGDEDENDENSDEDNASRGIMRFNVKRQADKDYSPRETRSDKTDGSGKEHDEIVRQSKRQWQNAKRKTTKSKEPCISCKKLDLVMKKVSTQLAGKNIAKTAIKCFYCKRYFISMFHLELHIEGNHLQCENKIPCKKLQNVAKRKFRKRAELDCEDVDDPNDDVMIMNENSSFRTNASDDRSLDDSKQTDESSNTKGGVKRESNNFSSQSDESLSKNRPTFDCALCEAKFSKSTEYVRHVREVHDFTKLSATERENRTKILDENEESASSRRSNEVSPVGISKKLNDEIFDDSKIGSDDQMTADREYLLKQLLSDDPSDDDETKSSSKQYESVQESQTGVLGDTMTECIDKSGKKVVMVMTPHTCSICDKKFLRAHDLIAHGLVHEEIETKKIIVDCPQSTKEDEKGSNYRHGLFSDPFADDRNFDDYPKLMENDITTVDNEISDRLSNRQSNNDTALNTDEEANTKVVIGVKRVATPDVDEIRKTSSIVETMKKPRKTAKNSSVNERREKVVTKSKKPIERKGKMKKMMMMDKTMTEENDADDKILECTKCNRNFPTRTLLNEHLFYLHDDTLKDTVLTGLLTPASGKSDNKTDGPYHCEDCNTDFKWMPGYRRHKYIHHGDDSQVHVCENCCKILTSITMVNVHICSDVASYNCRTCNETFQTGMSLRLHNSEKHIEKNETHFCHPCKKQFLTKAMLERHVRGEHKFLRPYRPRRGSPVRMATAEEIFQEKKRKLMAEREIKKSLTGPRPPPRRAKKFKNLDKIMDEVIASSDIMWNENEDNSMEEEPSMLYDDMLDDCNDESIERLEDYNEENLESLEDYNDENIDSLEDNNHESLNIFKNETDEDTEEITSEIRSMTGRIGEDNGDHLDENLVDEGDFQENLINEYEGNFGENLIDEEEEGIEENWIDDVEKDYTENLLDQDKNDFKHTFIVTHDDERENLCSQNDDEETKTSMSNETTKPRRGGWRACRGKKIIENERSKKSKRHRPPRLPGKRRRGRPRKYPLTDEETTDESSQDEDDIDVWRESILYIDETDIHQCSLCLLYCLSRSTLRNHMAKIHSTTDEICQLCQKVYPTGKLIRHMIEKHITPDDTDKTMIEIGWQLGKDCNEIDMELFVKMMGINRLVSLYEYRRYNETTARLTTYPCPACDDKFPSSELYRYHYLLHHDTMCAVCNIEYKTGHDAARHKGEIHGSVGRYIWFADRTLKALMMTQNFAKFAERNFIDLITRDETADEEKIPDDNEDTMNDSIDETENWDYTEVFVHRTTDENLMKIGNVEETMLIDDISYDENPTMITNDDETTIHVAETNLSNEHGGVDEEERPTEGEIFLDETETNEMETTFDQITNLVVEDPTVITNEKETTLQEASLLDGNMVIMTNEGQIHEKKMLFDENIMMVADERFNVDEENFPEEHLTIMSETERTVDESLLDENVTNEAETEFEESTSIFDENISMISNEGETEIDKSTSFIDEKLSMIKYKEESSVITDENLLRKSPTTITDEDENIYIDEGTLDESYQEITNEAETTILDDENPSEERTLAMKNEGENMLVDEYILPNHEFSKSTNENEISRKNLMKKMVTSIADEIKTNLVADKNFWIKDSTFTEVNETMIDEDAGILDEKIPTIVNEANEETMDDVDSILSDDFAEPDDINMIIVVTDEDLDEFNITTRYPNIWGLAAKISATFDGVTPKEVKDLLACHFEREEDFDTNNCV